MQKLLFSELTKWHGVLGPILANVGWRRGHPRQEATQPHIHKESIQTPHRKQMRLNLFEIIVLKNAIKYKAKYFTVKNVLP